MFKVFKEKGQSSIEYVVLLIIVIGAFIGMSNYFKRGISGRWKETVDNMGDQYDPRYTNGSVRHILISNTETRLDFVQTGNGSYTLRTDLTNAIELKQGSYSIGAY